LKNRICHISSAHTRSDIRIFIKQCQSIAKSDFEIYFLVIDQSLDENINGVKIVNCNIENQKPNRFERMFYGPKMIQKNELFSLQLPHLLKYEDKNAMSYSIETRVPFVDHRNIETALSIDSELKIKNGWSKYILRKIMDKIMPDSLVWRKDKIGFELDEDHFFKTIEKEFFELLIESEIAKKLLNKNQNADSLSRLSTRHKWRLYNLIKWEKEFNVYL